MRLPFFYGWVIVAVTFVAMAIGVNARTAFSLFYPPIISEFGWERGITAGAFSFGFVASAIASPLIGRLMDRSGPRAVMELGVLLMGSGLLLAPLTTQPWHLYLTIGVLVGSGSVCLGYSGQSLFVPNWFIRRRGLAIGLAFAGVGIGSVTLLPWVQHMIEHAAGAPPAPRWGSWCWSCSRRSICCCTSGRKTSACSRTAMRRRPPHRRNRHRTSSIRPGPASTGAAARAADRAVLVDRDRLFLRPVHLVRGAGAPDQIPARHRLQLQCRRLGARRRQLARDSRPDLARAPVRSHRS